ncbi:hypothetical protein [Streptomyces sp. NBC_00878]|uniref:hypothetical protein n=1 Tax=Streptomyces sp. NBC_00878 TaxID=2975854 RepID=UPI0022513593|nr:hypothetical protein [Streptomyces sp. NBC_00878]MCX4903209.1 hypothetical protein [Streptomyces sp. NBC_00878]
MTDDRTKRPGEDGGPVPRDMPDQQAQAGGDRWDVPPADPARRDGSDEDAPEQHTDVPDTDEAGTRRRGDEHASSTVHPEHPGPEESPA